jgi:hypothetical protein
VRPFMLYHWSPRKNRNGILRHGLCPGKLSCIGADWRPPYVCFARYPSVAWALSATHSGKRGEWDLWCCWSDVAPYKTLNAHGGKKWWLTEYRISRRMPKRILFHVGTKRFTPRKKRTANARPVRTDGPPRDSGTHEAVVGGES